MKQETKIINRVYESRYLYSTSEVEGFNARCHRCGFPNFDYQVSLKTGLCRSCEIKDLRKSRRSK